MEAPAPRKSAKSIKHVHFILTETNDNEVSATGTLSSRNDPSSKEE